MKKIKVKEEVKSPYPVCIETFRQLAGYSLESIRKDTPSCFNGIANVVKYRVTVEIVEEPIEVIHARLQDLWDRLDNFHNVDPIRREAAKHGYGLQGGYGSKRVR